MVGAGGAGGVAGGAAGIGAGAATAGSGSAGGCTVTCGAEAVGGLAGGEKRVLNPKKSISWSFSKQTSNSLIRVFHEILIFLLDKDKVTS